MTQLDQLLEKIEKEREKQHQQQLENSEKSQSSTKNDDTKAENASKDELNENKNEIEKETEKEAKGTELDTKEETETTQNQTIERKDEKEDSQTTSNDPNSTAITTTTIATTEAVNEVKNETQTETEESTAVTTKLTDTTTTTETETIETTETNTLDSSQSKQLLIEYPSLDGLDSYTKYALMMFHSMLASLNLFDHISIICDFKKQHNNNEINENGNNSNSDFAQLAHNPQFLILLNYIDTLHEIFAAMSPQDIRAGFHSICNENIIDSSSKQSIENSATGAITSTIVANDATAATTLTKKQKIEFLRKKKKQLKKKKLSKLSAVPPELMEPLPLPDISKENDSTSRIKAAIRGPLGVLKHIRKFVFECIERRFNYSIVRKYALDINLSSFEMSAVAAATAAATASNMILAGASMSNVELAGNNQDGLALIRRLSKTKIPTVNELNSNNSIKLDASNASGNGKVMIEPLVNITEQIIEQKENIGMIICNKQLKTVWQQLFELLVWICVAEKQNVTGILKSVWYLLPLLCNSTIDNKTDENEKDVNETDTDTKRDSQAAEDMSNMSIEELEKLRNTENNENNEKKTQEKDETAETKENNNNEDIAIKTESNTLELELRSICQYLSNMKGKKSSHFRDGQVFCFAKLSEGRCGMTLKGETNLIAPKLNETLKSCNIIKVDTFSTHTLALSNKNLQCGLGKAVAIQSHPIMLSSAPLFDKKVCDVAAGMSHSVICTEDGQVFTFGAGSQHRLGTGDATDRPKPTLVIALHGIKCVKVGAGSAFSFAIDENGKLYSWGKNDTGQCGLKHREAVRIPTQVLFILMFMFRIWFCFYFILFCFVLFFYNFR